MGFEFDSTSEDSEILKTFFNFSYFFCFSVSKFSLTQFYSTTFEMRCLNVMVPFTLFLLIQNVSAMEFLSMLKKCFPMFSKRTEDDIVNEWWQTTGKTQHDLEMQDREEFYKIVDDYDSQTLKGLGVIAATD